MLFCSQLESTSAEPIPCAFFQSDSPHFPTYLSNTSNGVLAMSSIVYKPRVFKCVSVCLPTPLILLIDNGHRNSFSFPCGTSRKPLGLASLVAILLIKRAEDRPQEIGNPVSFMICALNSLVYLLT